jgi:hypothetical protein
MEKDHVSQYIHYHSNSNSGDAMDLLVMCVVTHMGYVDDACVVCVCVCVTHMGWDGMGGGGGAQGNTSVRGVTIATVPSKNVSD